MVAHHSVLVDGEGLFGAGDGVAAHGPEGGGAVPVPGRHREDGVQELPLLHLGAVLHLIPLGRELVDVRHSHVHLSSTIREGVKKLLVAVISAYEEG